MEARERWNTLYHLQSSGRATSGAGVSQGTADFILEGRHTRYKQHVGHSAQTLIRSQAALFLRTSWANRRGRAYTCTDVHRTPALPPTRLFVSTHPETQSLPFNGPEYPQGSLERTTVLGNQSETWSLCSSEFVKDQVVWTPEHHRHRSPPV